MFQTTEYKIDSARIPAAFDGFRMVQLSDLHGAVYGKNSETLIREVKKAGPDIVVMTGDMMDNGRGAVDLAVRLCMELVREYPVYYALGNHEQTLEKGIWQKAKRQLKESGVVFLENNRAELVRNGEMIRLYGLVMPLVYYKDPFGEFEKGVNFYKKNVQECLGNADRSKYNILLAHNPLYFPACYNWGADLTLSGHVHGGIIHVPGIGGLLSPDLTFFPKYDAGHFEKNGRHMIVSRGLGNRFLFRVFNPAEMVVITLEHSCFFHQKKYN